MRLLKGITIAAVLSLAVACSPSGNRSTGGYVDAVNETAVATLPLPEPPAMITDPQQRASYVMAHFFDMLDFSDRSLSLDTAFVEQNMANYLALSAYVDEAGLRMASRRLMEQVASGGDEVMAYWVSVIEKYLYYPDSPMRSEDTFIVYAKAIGESEAVAPEVKLRTSHLLAMSMLNRPGDIASSFDFTDRQGKRRSLHGSINLQGLTVVMFYNPDCPTCADLFQCLAESETFVSSLRSGDVSALAIYPGTDQQLWLDNIGKIPQGWTAGIDGGAIDDGLLYDLVVIPVIYLLDPQGRVLYKDIDIEMLLKVIASHNK